MKNIRDDLYIYMIKNIQDYIVDKAMRSQISFNYRAHLITGNFFRNLKISIDDITPKQNFF